MCHESTEMQIFFVFKLVSWILFHCGCDSMYPTNHNFTVFVGKGQRPNIGNCRSFLFLHMRYVAQANGCLASACFILCPSLLFQKVGKEVILAKRDTLGSQNGVSSHKMKEEV